MKCSARGRRAPKLSARGNPPSAGCFVQCSSCSGWTVRARRGPKLGCCCRPTARPNRPDGWGWLGRDGWVGVGVGAAPTSRSTSSYLAFSPGRSVVVSVPPTSAPPPRSCPTVWSRPCHQLSPSHWRVEPQSKLDTEPAVSRSRAGCWSAKTRIPCYVLAQTHHVQADWVRDYVILPHTHTHTHTIVSYAAAHWLGDPRLHLE